MKKRMERTLTRSLAVLLAILMLVAIFPMSVLAQMLEDGSAETLTPYNDEPFELVELREENVKHFQNADGTVVAAIYPNAVHYKDDDGTWQDIDNTLTGGLVNYSDARERVKFVKKTSGNGKLFTLHEGEHKITLSMNDANKKVKGTITNTATAWGEDATSLQKMAALDKLSAKILYPDIVDGVDLEYVVVSNSIKENIIVKSPQSSYTYEFTLKLNNLTARLTEDGEVMLCDSDSGKPCYRVPAPFMVDASGVRSEAVAYSLAGNGNGNYSLVVTADSAWINAAGRAFPV